MFFIIKNRDLKGGKSPRNNKNSFMHLFVLVENLSSMTNERKKKNISSNSVFPRLLKTINNQNKGEKICLIEYH